MENLNSVNCYFEITNIPILLNYSLIHSMFFLTILFTHILIQMVKNL